MTDESRTRDERALERLQALIPLVRDEGSPIVASPRRDEVLAGVALRRWRSFERRNKGKDGSLDRRTEDLAKGIRDAVEPDRQLVGPLMEDYRYLAGRLAEVLADE